MKCWITLPCLLLPCLLAAQTAVLKGKVQNPEGEPVVFANVVLYRSADSVFTKAGVSDDAGRFELQNLKAGNYYVVSTYLGLSDLKKTNIQLLENQTLDLETLTFQSNSVKLAEATISATRPFVEVKADRTVFNVEGTINNIGTDALSLLRKAPAVTVDNNDNLSLLGRSGVLVYVDGKRLPLSGADLSTYLQNLPAEVIDRIEIITNPGAKYEAEGNAGIIDIRLKKNKNLGANGALNSSVSQGKHYRSNLTGNGNYRNKYLNAFGTASIGSGVGINEMDFVSYLNNMVQEEINDSKNDWRNYNYRAGIDFPIAEYHTIGLLAGGGKTTSDNTSYNHITLAQAANPTQIDSILIANNTANSTRKQQTYNLNYRYDNTKGRSFNFDLDYGNYNNQQYRFQPNRYYDASESVLKTEIINRFDTPTDIDIYTLQADYEDNMLGGKLGFGSKLSKVVSNNTFLVFDELQGVVLQNDMRSNRFKYNEKVYAAYLNYSRDFGKKWQFSGGLRAEKTDAVGDLKAFLPNLQEPPVVLNYLSWFPTLGLTWQQSDAHAFSFNAGRRINRPDYNVLNPFNNQISQLSYEKGNPFLRPEIVNNIELGYTLLQQYNLKVGYSRTSDQITRLIAPDVVDPRAGFITWANLANQTIYSLNLSVPVQISKKWNAYFNASAAHLNNQANYGNGAVVDVQAFTYTIYQQHTFDLPHGFKAEVSGYYSGPGIWGGVFVYESSWSLDVGLQRKFLKDRLTVKVSASDLFFQSGWDGYSDFNGLLSYGGGNWDSRRGSLSLSYRFGNENVKARKRSTGIEAEAGRVKE
ncbi:MAG: TonB-dependent receptor domain-containing protein [Saprospiraceae bacterium]